MDVAKLLIEKIDIQLHDELAYNLGKITTLRVAKELLNDVRINKSHVKELITLLEKKGAKDEVKAEAKDEAPIFTPALLPQQVLSLKSNELKKLLQDYEADALLKKILVEESKKDFLSQLLGQNSYFSNLDIYIKIKFLIETYYKSLQDNPAVKKKLNVFFTDFISGISENSLKREINEHKEMTAILLQCGARPALNLSQLVTIESLVKFYPNVAAQLAQYSPLIKKEIEAPGKIRREINDKKEEAEQKWEEEAKKPYNDKRIYDMVSLLKIDVEQLEDLFKTPTRPVSPGQLLQIVFGCETALKEGLMSIPEMTSGKLDDKSRKLSLIFLHPNGLALLRTRKISFLVLPEDILCRNLLCKSAGVIAVSKGYISDFNNIGVIKKAIERVEEEFSPEQIETMLQPIPKQSSQIENKTESFGLWGTKTTSKPKQDNVSTTKPTPTRFQDKL